MIPQFSVTRAPRDGAGAPYLVVLQSHLTELPTTIVAPLRPYEAPIAGPGVLIPVMVAGEALLLDLAQLAYIPTPRLGRPVASLAEHEDAIRRGIDRLFTGF